MDPITLIALQTIGVAPADLVYVLTHSEQVDALNVARESYLAAVRQIASQVPPQTP